MAYFTSQHFPANREVKEASGLPWGCIIQPFRSIPNNAITSIPASRIARCEHCYAYINPFVRFGKTSWACSLCRQLNHIPAHYADVKSRTERPELVNRLIEYELDEVEKGGVDEGRMEEEYPTYIFCVDVSGNSDYIELVKSSILAALEALSPEVFVGICVFSDKIGLYDLRCSVPHVRNTRIHTNGFCSVALEDMFPLKEFLVKLGTSKDNICAAVESIEARFPSSVAGNENVRPSSLSTHTDSKHTNPTSTSTSTSTSNTKSGSTEGVRCGFGSTLEYIVNYLSSVERQVNGRLLLFLANRPNYGAGALESRYNSLSPSSSSPDDEGGVSDTELLIPQTDFYQQQAIHAAKSGICCDLYVVSDHKYIDISSLKYLSLLTGGNLLLYEDTKSALLPQDIFRQLKKPLAFRGLLRLRTSREFQPSSIYGHIIGDETYDNLFHVAGIDPHKCMAFNFEFSSGSGFTSYSDAKPIVQLAFAYTVLERFYDEETEREIEEPVRRLRVQTFRLETTTEVSGIYESVNSEVVIGMLSQQAIQRVGENGIEETRLLLQDWLINLLSKQAEHLSRLSSSNPLDSIDTQFSQYPQLNFFPRFVFGLLKSRLLTTDRGENPDYRVYLQCLYSALKPSFLCKAIYPNLTAFSDMNSAEPTKMILSLDELNRRSSPLYILDSYNGLYVLYTHTAVDVPFPPPHTCKYSLSLSLSLFLFLFLCVSISLCVFLTLSLCFSLFLSLFLSLSLSPSLSLFLSRSLVTFSLSYFSLCRVLLFFCFSSLLSF